MTVLSAARANTAPPAPPSGNTWAFAGSAASLVTVVGIALDRALGGRGFPAPSWPLNLGLLAGFVLFQVGVFLALRRTRLFAGLAGGRLAVTALALVAVWAIFLGSLPQAPVGVEAPLVQRVMQAPPFVLALLLLLANLGFGILKQLSGTLSAPSLVLANHLGLYIAGSAMLFGSGDLVRLDVWVREGELAWVGTARGRTQELPFALHLHEFRRERFPAQLTVVDAVRGEVLLPPGQDLLTLLPGARGTLAGHGVEVREATDAAPWSVPGDPVPAAYVTVTAPDGARAEGWISAGTPLSPPVFLGLGPVSFVCPEPRVRVYESRLTLVRPHAEPREVTVRVNEPLRVDGWWLYQKDYDVSGGPGARLSNIEAVRDPWLPAVLVGLLLMGAGALLCFARAGTILRAAGEPGRAEPRP